MNQPSWSALAQGQHGMLARRQLLPLGFDRQYVRTQVRAGRWQVRSPTVVSTITGELTTMQRCWLGVLHASAPALVGGVSAACLHGLTAWHRDDISILVPDNVVLDPIVGIKWVRTRRNLPRLADASSALPTARIEPAILMFGAGQRSARTAVGILAAAVQQGLTTPARLTHWIGQLRPLRRAARLRAALTEMAGGAQSLGEIEVSRMCRDHGLAPPSRQAQREDSAGRRRYLDCEWQLPGGRVVVLEVDGGFHMEAGHWQADIARERALTSPLRTIVRCTTEELRDGGDDVARDLRRLGVPRAGRPPGRVLLSGANTPR